MVICLAIYLLLKKRRRGKTKGAPSDYAEKPELHANDIKPIRSELDGGMALESPQHHAVELPAREIVGAEMNAESVLEAETPLISQDTADHPGNT